MTCVSSARQRSLSGVLHLVSGSTWPHEALHSSFHPGVEGLGGALNRWR